MFKSRIRKLEERVEALEKRTTPGVGASIHFQPLVTAEISERKELEELMKESFSDKVRIAFPAEIPCGQDFTDGIDYAGAIERFKGAEERVEALEKHRPIRIIQAKCSGMSIGECIKTKRLAFGYSQENLAEQVGIGRSMMAQIERGSKIPNMLLGKSIAQALGCKVEDLYGEG